jgi:hypothetical protein
VLPLAGLGIVLGSIIRNQHVPSASSDTWFHLRFGHEFLAGWSLDDPGHLGVYDNAQWVPTQWLPQLGMAFTQEHFGIAGVMWVTGVLLTLLAVLVYTSCRRLASPLPAAIATTLGLMAASPGMSARPQVLSYIFIVLTVAAWLATARDGKPRYWVVAVAWLWPMLHGMWPVGVSISVVAVVGLGIQRDLPRRAFLRLAAIPLLSCIVVVLNPVGPAVVRSLFDVGSRSQYFAEWGPPDFTKPAAAVLVVMLVLVVIAGLRTPPLPWVQAGLIALALVWGLYSLRTTPVSALILAPLVGAALQSVVPNMGRMTRSEWVTVSGMFGIGCLVLLLVAGQRDSEEVVPDWVDTQLDALPPGTKVLNDWNTGSYFLFRHDDLDLVMHGYGDVFTDDELERNTDLIRLEPGWEDLVAELDADVALMDPDSPLGAALHDQLGWSQVEADSEFALLSPP